MTENDGKQKLALNARLESGAWAVFIIMIGVLWMLPSGTLIERAWLIGAGVIMLLLNLVRVGCGIRPSGFTVVLGLLALGMGLADYFGVELPIVPALLVIFGLVILVKTLGFSGGRGKTRASADIIDVDVKVIDSETPADTTNSA